MIRISILRLKRAGPEISITTLVSTNDKNLNSEIETSYIAINRTPHPTTNDKNLNSEIETQTPFSKGVRYGKLPMIRISILRLKRYVDDLHQQSIQYYQ